jgi:hypothetical protein
VGGGTGEILERAGLQPDFTSSKAGCPRCRRHEPLLESGLCQRCDDVIQNA